MNLGRHITHKAIVGVVVVVLVVNLVQLRSEINFAASELDNALGLNNTTVDNNDSTSITGVTVCVAFNTHGTVISLPQLLECGFVTKEIHSARGITHALGQRVVFTF